MNEGGSVAPGVAGEAPEQAAAERLLARSIVRRMGETGQPPERGALRVNVGTHEILEALRREYLEPIRAIGMNSTFKLVQGTFGGGKSQFLCSFREVAWAEGFATVLVGVSPQECPFDDLRRIYQRVAECIELPPESEYVEPGNRGIDAVLQRVVEERREQAGESELLDWLREECMRASVESHAWRRAATLFMRAVVRGDSATADLLASWLRGESVPLREVQELGVRESLEPSTAFRWLRSLVQFLRAVGLPGVVLMFDEMDRAMSLSRRRRKDIGDNLRQLIDSCGQSVLPAAVCLYAVPPEFMTTVVPEYPALEQRLKGPNVFTQACPVAPIIDLEHLPLEDAMLLREIGAKLLELYRVAYPEAALDPELQGRNLAALAAEITSSQLESGSRRTFVRAAVAMLSEQHHGGQRPLSPDDVRSLTGTGPAAGPPPLEGDEGEEIF